MDPFAKLAPEIRVEIIIKIESQTSIMDLIRASPVMCSQYVSCKKSITRQILTNIISGPLHEDLLQDALGILHFPSNDNVSIRRHIAQWTAKGIPDPFRQSCHDHDTILKLHRIFSRIIMFIEDYVSKATDPFPPRAYLALPPIASGSDRLFKGHTVGIKPVSFNALTASERDRFLGTFLRYEMLCKVYNPPVWNIIKDTHYAHLLSEAHEKLLPTELKALQCVREYVKAVYGAVFSHLQDAWLPDRPVASPSEPFSTKGLLPRTKYGLLYPDTVYFSAVDYFKTVNDTSSYRLADILPCLGFDLLTHILVSFNKDGRYGQYLKTWLYAFTKQLGSYCSPWSFGEHFFSRYEKSIAFDSAIFFRGLQQESCRNRSATLQLHRHRQSYWQAINDRDPWARQQNQHELQLMIYRQRAWGFFDDTRLYPDTAKHFPTIDDLDEQERIAGKSMAPCYERSRRRSQRWQDWYSGRCIESPLDEERQEPLREVEAVEDNYDDLPRFFGKPSPGKISTFWR